MSDFFATSSSSIEGLNIHFNSDGWGPVTGETLSVFDEVPYAHFDKKDKCSRAADFTFNNNVNNNNNNNNNQRQQYQKFNKRGEDGNSDFTYRHDVAEDNTFQLVDTSKTQSKGSKKNNFQQQGRGQQGRGFAGRGAASRAGKGQEPQFSFQRREKRGPGAGRGGAGRGRGFRRDRKLERMPSLTVGGDWNMVEEFDLVQMLKLQFNPPAVQDLLWAGHLAQYDEQYDKVTTRTAKPLKRIENKVFYSVTSEEDPILEKFAAEEVGNVYATDSILAHLMASPRSVYSWDIVCQKVDGIIFLDKRENSVFDYLTVSESAHEPPQASDEVDEINHPEKLSIEATMINQNFSQQVLKDDISVRKVYEPNPFYEDDDSGVEPASVAYRYRKFTLGNVNLVARCELHAWMNKRNEEQLMTVYALNEWDSKFSGGVNWRQKIDQQRGAVLATELKNNSNKLAKWTAQSIIAGAQQMKVGYVSRVSNTNAYDHSVLATQYFKPKELATQINLGLTNMWGIIKMICDLLLSKDDGKYVLMKDPNKATVRLYSVPLDAFDAEDDEEEEDGEDKDGGDDDDVDDI
jgi:translation initiation factor 3 subunit D